MLYTIQNKFGQALDRINLIFSRVSDISFGKMIDINDITVRIGQRVLLDHASVHIADCQKVGIVGLNGCGKSTLFRVLTGEYETEQGEINFPKEAIIATVSQEMKNIEIAEPMVTIKSRVNENNIEELKKLADEIIK